MRVAHYPSGTSKYNPIEHRLFSFISKNWRGEPLISYEKALGYIESTSTEMGLKVFVTLTEKEYELGKTKSKDEMDVLDLRKGWICPQWNYEIYPRLVFN